MTDISFVLKVVFYRSEAGNEPVREWLKDLHRDDKRQIGEDIKTAQLGWPLGMPLIKKIDKNIEPPWYLQKRLKMKNKNLGSNFDDFLEEEGLRADAEAAAIKKVIAYQIEIEMKQANLSKTAMAEKMHTSRTALDRLLDPANVSVTLQTLERAALVLGKSLKIELA